MSKSDPRRTAHNMVVTQSSGISHRFGLSNGELKEFLKQLADPHTQFVGFKTLVGDTIMLNKREIFGIKLTAIMRS